MQKFYTNDSAILVAVDCIVFGFDDNQLKLLLFERQVEPFKNEWSLVGSFIKADESMPLAAERILFESTGIKQVFMESSGIYSEVDRDPGGRVITLSVFALIRSKNIKLKKDFKAQWFDYDQVPKLVLDHNSMVIEALEKLRQKARHQPIGFELLPEKFTILQLRSLYEAIYQRELDRRNFRKKILSMDILEKLEEKDKVNSRKGAFLYRFNKKKYEKLTAKGFNFEV